MAQTEFDGIHFMLPTPFDYDGGVDFASLARCVSHAKASGCTGVVTLGVMGEAHRLLESERDAVVDAVVAASSGELKVSVGISSESAELAAARLELAQDAGADAVMAAPPRMAKPNDAAVARYYAEIDSRSRVPLIVQDLPEQTGVHMAPDMFANLRRDLTNDIMVKLEDPPTPPKISRILQLVNDVPVFGGLGGSFLYEELRRGASGAMTGFAYSEVLVAIHCDYAAGRVDAARRMFYDWLPLIRYENSVGLGLSIRKHILKWRGLIERAAVRPPTPAIDVAGAEELRDLMAGMREVIDALPQTDGAS